MTIEITFTITAIIALCSLISPIIVAKLNNSHQEKMRKLELDHDLLIQNVNTKYVNKHRAYSEFMIAASEYINHSEITSYESKLLSSLHSALLLCEPSTEEHLLMLKQIVDEGYYQEEQSYKLLLSTIAASFNHELSTLSQPHNE